MNWIENKARQSKHVLYKLRLIIQSDPIRK